MGTYVDFLASGPTVDVHPLTEEPTSMDPSTWSKPNFPGYSPAQCQIQLVLDQRPSGLVIKLRPTFVVEIGAYTIVSWGMTSGGTFVACGNFNPSFGLFAGVPQLAEIRCQVNPVLF